MCCETGLTYRECLGLCIGDCEDILNKYDIVTFAVDDIYCGDLHTCTYNHPNKCLC